ncbi:MAG: HYR domain-containing protein, partial [Thermoproteota archaeon]|nr:HYR domain-containing protein [Thermoproteota archaeon]
PGEFAESGQEILGGFELEVLESYEVALPQNFMAWMMVIGNEDRQDRLPAAVGVVCASDANDAETRVLSPEEQQQINNVVQQFTTTQVTSIDQVINIINNATTNATGGGGGTTPSLRDTTPPVIQLSFLLGSTSSPTGMTKPYRVLVTDNVDGAATLREDGSLSQDDVGGLIDISCNPPANANFPVGNHTVTCRAVDAAGNRGTASFPVTVTPPSTTPPGGSGTSTITASTNPAIYNGVSCPSTPLEFSGTITDNVGNRDVRYRFIFSTGASTPEQVIRFNQPGSQTVTYTSPGVIPPGLQGWVAIEILQPVQLQSNQAEMRITCAPAATATCQGKIATRPSTPGKDVILGTEGPDVIAGLGGDDVIEGLGGDDTICGGEDNDSMDGGFGVDTMYGDGGSDAMYGADNSDDMNGGIGDDVMSGDAGIDRMAGGEGNDNMYGFDGNDLLDGGPNTDTGDGGADIDQCINFETPVSCETASLVPQQPLLGNETTTLDTTAPTVTVPNNMEVETTDPSGAVALYEVTAADNVDGTATLAEDGITITQDNVNGSITIACNPPSGSTFPVGDTRIDCTATDAAGNVGTASFTVTVELLGTPPPTEEAPLVVEEEEEEEEEPIEEEEEAPVEEGNEGAASPPANGEGGG